MKIVVCDGRFEVFSEGVITEDDEYVLLEELRHWVDVTRGFPSDEQLMVVMGKDCGS